MKLLINIFLFVLSSYSFPQNYHTVALADRESAIDLNFIIDQIIFDEKITDTIGQFIRRKKIAPLIFQGENTKQVLNNWFKGNFTSNVDDRIILRINKVLVHEYHTEFQSAVSMSFIKKSQNDCYLLKTLVKENYGEQPALLDKSASPIRGEFVASLFEEAIKEFNLEYKKGIQPNELNCEELTEYSETFHHDVDLVKGDKDTLLVYSNYYDVLTNNPTSKFIKLKKVRLKNTSPEIFTSTTNSEGIWGVKLNDTIYKKVGAYFYKVNAFLSTEPYILAPKNALNIKLEKSNSFGFTTFIVGGTLSALLIGMDAVNPGIGILIGTAVGVTTELLVFLIKKKSTRFYKQEIDSLTGLLLMK